MKEHREARDKELERVIDQWFEDYRPRQSRISVTQHQPLKTQKNWLGKRSPYMAFFKQHYTTRKFVGAHNRTLKDTHYEPVCRVPQGQARIVGTAVDLAIQATLTKHVKIGAGVERNLRHKTLEMLRQGLITSEQLADFHAAIDCGEAEQWLQLILVISELWGYYHSSWTPIQVHERKPHFGPGSTVDDMISASSDDDMLRDIRMQVELFLEKHPLQQKDSLVVLQPIAGIASAICGDADIMINQTLIDIKSGMSNCKISGKDVEQLILYAHLLNCEQNSERLEHGKDWFNNVAIYASRFGVTHSFDLHELTEKLTTDNGRKQTWNETQAQFQRLVDDMIERHQEQLLSLTILKLSQNIG